MIQVERRTGSQLAAGICAAALAMVVCLALLRPVPTRRATPSHEPTSAELFDYLHGALLAYSPEDRVNDNLDITIDPTATILTIQQPDGHCDIFMSAWTPTRLCGTCTTRATRCRRGHRWRG